MRFKRSEGLTASERFLAYLCDNSFLKLWTYPNLFKNVAKELTDLLVVFEREVLIFSDKSCRYPSTGDARLDWSRWYRRSIEKSVHQINQAERWLKAYPERVFLDAKCETRLPISLPPADEMNIHRICVALGAAERAESETGKRGLSIDPAVKKDAKPFTIGQAGSNNRCIHVFDEESLQVVLKELSTISDFVEYLNSKSRVFESGKFRHAESELDVLAYYLWNNRNLPDTKNYFYFESNLWSRVESDESFLRGRNENRVSYFWDRLIEYITDNYINRTLEIGNDIEINDYEKLARLMAGETRFFRRILAKAILERAERAQEHAISSLLVSCQPEVNYVLYIGKGVQGSNHSEYRADRALELQARCIAAKSVKPDKRFVVGIALDASGVRESSEDFLLLDTIDWSKEEIERAQKLRENLGYFLPGSVVETRLQENEYPEASK